VLWKLCKVITILIYFFFIVIKVSVFDFFRKRVLKKRNVNVLYNDNWEPVTKEVTKRQIEVIGKVPDDMDGMYVRNGPNPYLNVADQEFYHLFDGDGMLHGVNFESSKNEITYLNRWIKTGRLEEEKRTGIEPHGLGTVRHPVQMFHYVLLMLKSALLGIIRTSDETGAGAANTSVEYHAGRFLALYEGDIPFQVALPSLETISKYDFKGQLGRNKDGPKHFTAHPKVDPHNHDLIAFEYRISAFPYCRYFVFDKQDKMLTHFEITTIDPAVLMHDFAASKHFSVILVFPFFWDVSRVLKGQSPFYFDHNKNTRFGVFKRLAQHESEIQWFDSLPPCYMWHTMSCYDQGDEVVIIGCRSNEVDYYGITDISAVPDHPIPAQLTYLHMWRLNRVTGEVAEKCLTNAFGCEFPTINNRMLGSQARWGYVGRYADRAVQYAYIDACVKVDLWTASTDADKDLEYQMYVLPEGSYSGEWYFVPRVRGREGQTNDQQEEDDGYVMSYVYDSKTKESELWILDARDKVFGKKECLLARVKVGVRVPHGFHGKYVTRDEMKQQVLDI